MSKLSGRSEMLRSFLDGKIGENRVISSGHDGHSRY